MMKKRMLALALCVLMVGSVMLLSACKDDKPDDGTTPPVSSNEATYKVAVVNGVGQPYTKDLMITIFKDGEKVTMMPITEKGPIEKTLPKAGYTVGVASTDPEAKLYFDAEAAKLAEDKTELSLVGANEQAETGMTSHAPSTIPNEGSLDFEAFNVEVGSTHVKLSGKDRNYFLFVPQEEGVYEMSVSGNVATLGVYGGTTAYITSNSIHEVKDNKVTTTIYESMVSKEETGSSVLVIGLDAEADMDCILNVIRTADAPWAIHQEPWQDYEVQIPIAPFKLEEGVELKAFDITASEKYELVLNGATGQYHLGSVDGPRVFVQMEKEFYGISMKNIVGDITVDENGVQIPNGVAPFRYFYDNGPEDFFKEDYTNVMQQYVTDRDKATGVYPMTKDLYYILPMGIEGAGWLKEGGADYLFAEVDGVNAENAWLFFCCYEVMEDVPPVDEPTDDPNQGGTDVTVPPKQDPIEDNKNEPIVIGGTLSFDAEVKANHIVYYDLMRLTDTTLTIKNKNAYVIYDGKTYEAKNGVVTVPGLYSASPHTPIKVAIGNKGTGDATFAVTLSYPSGHRENPKALSFKTITVKNAKGESSGTYFTWKATESGTLTITLNSCTSAIGANVTVDCVSGNIPVQFVMGEDDPNSTVLVIEVQAGDQFTICVGAKPDDNWSYPAATIKVTPSFE